MNLHENDTNKCYPLSLRNAVLQEDLYSFLIKSFYTLNPSTVFLENWHLQAITEYLTSVTRGEIKRLVITMPPRHLKSITTTIAWPAWLLGQDATMRILTASYNQSLSTKHALDCRYIMQQKWYKHVFPNVTFNERQNDKQKFMTLDNGFRYSTSIGGAITGEGGDVLIVDDPHHPSEIYSRKKRLNTINWFDQIFSSRLDNKKQGVMVVVMQRLHPNDLAGHLLDTEKSVWEHLCLPAMLKENTLISIGHYFKLIEKETVLHAERESLDDMEAMKQALGTAAFSAQYLQQPVHLDGLVFKTKWLRYYDQLPSEPEMIIQSWDTAFSAQEGRSYTVCVTLFEFEHAYYITDIIRKRIEYPELVPMINAQIDRWNPHAILIENKSSGQAAFQEINRTTSLPLIPIQPEYDKFTRAIHASPLFEAGKIYLPKHADWLEDLIAELMGFPFASSDDQIDAITQALNWHHNRKVIIPRVRLL